MLQVGKFMWSDNWWLDGDKAYICANEIGALFSVDMNSLQCELVSPIPECNFTEYRLISYCRKYKNKVFCFPYEKENICYYDLETCTWGKIHIGHERKLIICMDPSSREKEDKIWVMEYMGERVYQIDLEKEIVEKEYTISQNGNIFTGEYALAQNKLYCVSGNEIYCIDIQNGNTCVFNIPFIKTELYTIYCDGYNFWLSGKSSEIYVWNPEQGIVKIITDFLKRKDSFYLDNSVVISNLPLFQKSFLVGKYMWYIPLQCNAPILYIDIEDYTVGRLEIEDERETEDSLKRRGKAFKYAVEYIRQDRYIGLYSCKNHIFFEIDTANMCVKNREYLFGNETARLMAQEFYSDKKILWEGQEGEREVFSVLFNSIENKEKTSSHIGEYIYYNINI